MCERHMAIDVRRAVGVFPRLCVLAMLSVGLAAATSGCFLALLAGGAAGAGAAIYYEGYLEQTLAAPVEKCHNAARAALKDIKLQVPVDKLDARTGHLESEYADGKHVWIDLESQGASLTRVKIRVGRVGDKERSAEILDKMKHRLGL